MATKTFKTGNLSFATATADDLLSGGDNNITRHELTSTTRNGAPLIVYLRKLPAAVGLRFGSGDVNTTDAMLQAIGNVLCDEHGTLIFEGRMDDVQNMPMDVFQELSGLVNEKILGADKTDKTDKADNVNGASDESDLDRDISIASTEGEV